MLEVWEKYGRLQKMLREKDADIVCKQGKASFAFQCINRILSLH